MSAPRLSGPPPAEEPALPRARPSAVAPAGPPKGGDEVEESDKPLRDVGPDGTTEPTDDEAGFLRVRGRPRSRSGADGAPRDPAPLRARAGALVDKVVTQLEERPEVRSRALQQLWDAELTLSEEYLTEHEALLAERRLTELEVELAEGAAKIRPR